MTQLLDVKDLDEDVLKTHPWLNSLGFVKRGVKRLGKKAFFKSLKFHYFIFDTKSPFRSSGYSEAQLIEEISVGLYGVSDHKVNSEHKEWITRFNLTPLEKEFEKTRLEVEGFNVMLAEWPWDQESAVKRIKTVGDFERFYTKFQQLGKRLKEEGVTTVGRAGSEPTFIENIGKDGGI